jgi:hypothetical protein
MGSYAAGVKRRCGAGLMRVKASTWERPGRLALKSKSSGLVFNSRMAGQALLQAGTGMRTVRGSESGLNSADPPIGNAGVFSLPLPRRP